MKLRRVRPQYVALALAPLCGPTAQEIEMGLARHAYVRGEKAVVEIKATPEQLKGLRFSLEGKSFRGRSKLPRPEEGKLTIDTGQWRVGEYQVVAQRARENLAGADLFICPARRPEFLYGNFLCRARRGGLNPCGELQDLGMNAAYMYGTGPDEALQYGIYLVHHGNCLRQAPKQAPKDERAALMQQFCNHQGERKAGRFGCTRNPRTVELATEVAMRDLKDLVGHPGLIGIGLDDEVGQFQYDWNDTGGVTCYCDSCKRQWKAKTGEEPPLPRVREPGTVIPDDDAFLSYMFKRSGWDDYYGPGQEDYNRELAERLHEARSDLIVFQTPGAASGELDVVHPELYDFWYSSPVTGGLATMSRANAIQHASPYPRKPLWPLIGWFQRLPAPQWTGNYIAAQARMSLAEGADAIWLTLMYWYDSRGRFKNQMLYEAEHVGPQVRAIGDLLRRFGPTLRRVTPIRYPMAVLYSKTTQLSQRTIDPAAIAAAKARGSWLEQPWQHLQATGMGFSALLRAGAPAEFITEEQILRGDLKDYQALVLLDHQYARKSVAEAIEAFQESGRKTFAGKGSPIRPEGTVGLPIDTAQFTRMINLGLRAARIGGEQLELVHSRCLGLEREWAFLLARALPKHLPEEARIVTSDNREVILRMGRSGATDYVFVLNTDVEDQQAANVTARVRGRYAQDLFGADPAVLAAVDNMLRARVVLPPGGWRVYAVSGEPLNTVTLNASVEGRVPEGRMRIEAAVVDANGKAVSGAFPLELAVLGPKGKPLPYGGHFATDAGLLKHDVRPAVNDPRGDWTLRVTNLMTGHAAEKVVSVPRN